MAVKSTKGYKVTNANRTRIFGVGCKSLAELKTKAMLKFQLGSENDVNLYLQDGTLVDDEDYFQTIPEQTCFVVAKCHETFLTGADLIYNVLASVNADLLRTGALAKDFISENIKEKLKILTKITLRPKLKNAGSTKEEDPEWFEGLDTRAFTKEEFMKRRCGDRIRGYFYKAVTDVKKSPVYAGKARKPLDQALLAMRERLTSAGYMGHYFVRGTKDAMCDKDGRFDCEGVWNLPQCKYNSGKGHYINPYLSREERITFSTWNLDHRIEKSRCVLPCLLKAGSYAASEENGHLINDEYFFELLFTRSNLRLVHIICHDKGAHTEATCDPSKLIIKV